MYEFNFLSILNLIVGSWILFMGIFLFLIRRQTCIHLTYFTTATWILGYGFAHSSVHQEVALFWCKFVYTAVIFIAPTMYHFVVVFWKFKKQRLYIWVNYIISVGFLGILFTTPHLIKGVRKFLWGYHTIASRPFHLIFLLFFSLVYGAGLFNLYKRYRQQKQERFLTEALRTRYFLLIYLICVIGAVDFLQDYGLVHFYPAGFLFPGIGVTLAAYAIIRYKLMDINIVLTRAGIFAFVYALILGIPFVIGSIVQFSLSTLFSYWWMIPLLIGIILASSGPFIYMRLQKRVESRLRAEEFKSHEALRQLSHNMLRFTKLEVLLKLVVHYLVKILKLKFGAIYLHDDQSNKYILNSFWQIDGEVKPPMEFSEESPLIRDLYLRRLPIVTEELRLFVPKGFSLHTKGLLAALTHLKANTIIPSFLRKGLLGFLVLSDRRTNVAFTQEDINLLMVLSNEAALSIENAQFHEREKMRLVEKSRREALADMAPGASHQFNNRLAAISSSAEVAFFKLENFKLDTIQDENLKKLLGETMKSLESIGNEALKGKDITSAILKRAKAKIEFQDIDIQQLIENAYRLVVISRSRSGFSEPRFKIKVAGKISKIVGSEALLQDVFYNMLDNDVDAIIERGQLISEGQLNIDFKYQGEIEALLRQEGQSLIIEVKDNGIGMTKEAKRKMFTPYFTTKATSGKGSGLGLYIIREFIEKHGGTIMCESEYGKGTTFTIKLPIKI